MEECVSNIPHKELVSAVLASVQFHTERQQITLRVPLGDSTADHMMFIVNLDTRQLVIDVFQGERLQYSGIIAADMHQPMCPVFKH